MPAAPSLRVGTDLCAVDTVRDAIASFGDRYLERIYTGEELHDVAGPDGAPAPERLAARFAAKEAVIKVLRPTDVRPDWRTISIRRDPGGWCEVELRGAALSLAGLAGIRDWSISITHETAFGAAVVVATIG